jgi:uncharacterized GH25 family protein
MLSIELRRLQRIAIAAAALGACLPAAAHDFWLQPQTYRPLPQASTALTLQVGHGRDRQRSAIALRRIVSFEAIGADGRRTDLRERLHPGAQDDGSFALPAGCYVLALQTDAGAQSHLPAIRFNDYLRAEGLTPALRHRLDNARMDAEGSESYSRRTKAIVQVGQAGACARDWLARPVGMPLEIVLDSDPYAQPRPARLSARVIYQGRPLAGALVKLTHLQDDAAPADTQRSDAAGRADFRMPAQGDWLLNVIWTRPLPASAETEYETVFSSLSFGFADAVR